MDLESTIKTIPGLVVEEDYESHDWTYEKAEQLFQEGKESLETAYQSPTEFNLESLSINTALVLVALRSLYERGLVEKTEEIEYKGRVERIDVLQTSSQMIRPLSSLDEFKKLYSILQENYFLTEKDMV